MTMQNPERVVTKQDLKDFYDEILPFLGGNVQAGFTPIGTIIPMIAETAPANYLICDGTAYNKVDYPELAAHLLSMTDHSMYVVDGDATKFKVPDLRGEFLRGTGTNSHTNMGNGADVGVHQDATGIRNSIFDKNITGQHVRFTLAESSNNEWKGQFIDSDSLQKTSASEGTKTLHYTGSVADGGAAQALYNYVRPTNTSVLYCIATKNIYMGGGGSTMNYSTDEQVVGTWIDGKPLYQKTCVISSSDFPTVSADGTNALSRLNLASLGVTNPDVLFIENAVVRNPTGIIWSSTHNESASGYAIRISATINNDDKVLDIHSKLTNFNGSTAIITLRYTKTTD